MFTQYLSFFCIINGISSLGHLYLFLKANPFMTIVYEPTPSTMLIILRGRGKSLKPKIMVPQKNTVPKWKYTITRNQFIFTIIFLQFWHSRAFLLQEGINPNTMLVKVFTFNGFEQLGQDCMKDFTNGILKNRL